MKEIITDMESLFRKLGEGTAKAMPKIKMDFEKQEFEGMNGWYVGMAGYAISENNKPLVGMKWLSRFNTNSRIQLPTLNSLIIINDPETGLPLAVADGNLITAMRTGATTAVGAKYLAKKDSEEITIIGSGVQGKSHLMALNELFKIKKVNVVGRNSKNTMQYVKEMSEKTNLNIQPHDSIKNAVNNSDIIIVATNSKTPVLNGEWLKRGFFVGSINMNDEIDDELPRISDKIVVDDLESILKRSSLQVKIERGAFSSQDIYGELSEIILKKKEGRITEEDNILLINGGIPVEDAVVLFRLYETAKKRGIGTKFRFQ